MIPVKYTEEARDDLRSAYRDYQRKSAGLGERFFASVQKAVEFLQWSPLIFGEVDEGIRAAKIQGFPFIIYYRPESFQVTILAVRHGHDDPAIWQSRA